MTASPAPPRPARHEVLYSIQLALLTTHQADAAYWHEWEILGVPGGIDFFLALNAVAVGALALGLVRVAQRAPSARALAWLCAGAGGLTIAIHGAVFAAGERTAFGTPSSLAVLGGIALVALAQVAALWRRPRHLG